MNQKRLVIIYGPTGVGKTDFSDELAHAINGEIINGDVGQFYKPLSIGTAKPNWQESSIPYHLFDVLDKPVDFTVTEYRNKVIDLCTVLWQKGKTPIVVGGSGFYITSLLFPPQQSLTFETSSNFDQEDTESLWHKLEKIDSNRAQKIHKNDRYRIMRALQIWQETGKKPSDFVPSFYPISPFLLVCLTRNRDQLYSRINERVITMMADGWVDEVQELNSTAWQNFLEDKKLIGYNDIQAYLSGTIKSYSELISIISQKTRNYAKRQMTFWRMLKKKLEPYTQDTQSCTNEINLTTMTSQVYIKEMLEKNSFFNFLKK